MLTTDQFTFSKETRILTAELSSLQMGVAPRDFLLKSSHTGKMLNFTLTSVDRDASGEDIFGYHYAPTDLTKNNISVLLIND